MYKRKRHGRKLLFGLTVMILCVTARDQGCKAASQGQQTDPGKILKELLESDGDAQIELKKDIVIHGTIHIRGKKRLVGRGHCIYRSNRADQFYGGTVFCVESGEFQVTDTVISGIGGKKVKRRTYGRLIEVKRGKFVLGKKSVLKENCNTAWGEEGGGAVLVRKNAQFLMKGGTICGNEIVTEGAAVKVEAGGTFIMRGGVIADNSSRGIGAIEGFDGRGGAVFNEGTVQIKKGQLRNNQAKAYRHGQDVYGGAGGAVYNRGTLLISGGTIYGSRGTCGGAIYNDKKASLRITNGRFTDNRADRGRTIFLRGGSCYLDVAMNLQKEIVKEKACRLVCGNRVPGSEPEEKDTKKHQETEAKKDTDRSRTDHTDAEKNVPKEEKEPVKIRWSGCEKKRIYYKGEFAGKEEILSGIRAYEGDKDVTAKIRIREFEKEKRHTSKSYRIDTGRCNKGVLHLYVEGKDRTPDGGKEVSGCRLFYQVKNNACPQIRTAPRYLFTWEVYRKSEKRLKQLLREGICMEDDRECADELWECAEIDWGGMDKGKEGTYQVSLTITDQWGHRFYMGDGEKRRYGDGRTCQVTVPVTLVDASDGTEDTSHGKVRFIKKRSGENEQEVQKWEEWTFDRESIRRIKKFLQERDPYGADPEKTETEQTESEQINSEQTDPEQTDPFSEETNEEFLIRFGSMRKIVESG